MNKACVNFFIYSPPKTGSTSLFHYLSQHPELDACRTKEPQYFSQLCDKQPISWYDNLFELSSNKLKFEASTTYFCHDTALDNIVHFCNNDIKFIVVLRNPIDRFISNYIHFKSQNIIINNENIKHKFINDPDNSYFIEEWLEESKKFKGIEENVNTILSSKFNILLHWSSYYRPVKKLLNTIDKNNILFIQYELFKENNQEYLNSIYQFLNIQSFNISNILEYNTAKFWGKFIQTSNLITDKHKEILKNKFHEDIIQLESLLGIKTQWI